MIDIGYPCVCNSKLLQKKSKLYRVNYGLNVDIYAVYN